MRLLFLLLLATLTGCGLAELTPDGTSTATLVARTDTRTPTDCIAMCERARPQLIRDFGIRPEAIDCPRQFAGANTCAECARRLEANFGVLPAGCP